MYQNKLNIINRPDRTKEQPRDPNKFWLDKNENTDQILNRKLKSLLKKISSKYIYSYPDIGNLYLLLSKYLRVNYKNLLLTHGSDGAIKTVFESFIEPGDHVIISNPTFAMYQAYGELYRAKIIYANYKIKKKKIFLDPNEIIFLLKKYKPKLLCIANPDSPSGQIIPELKLKKIINFCKKINTKVLMDEAYYLFYNKSLLKHIFKFHNLIICRSLGKAWGLAGLRIGFLVSNSKIITYLNSSKPMYEINNIAVYLFSEMLKKKNIKLVQESARRLLDAKKYFLNEIRKLNIFEFLDTKANFVHINFGPYREKIVNNLSKIAYIRDKQDFKYLKNYTRITLTNKNNFLKILKLIKKTIKFNGQTN